MMYPSLMFRINGVDVERAGPAPWRTVERLMDEAERAGTHTFPRKKPIVRPQRNPLEWRANLTQLRTADGGAIDGTDVDQLTLGELTGRQQALDAFTFIRDRTPGFEDSYIVDIAPQIGIRETRRIIGAYQLTEDDVLGCADFDDTIGVNGWPVEAHVAGTVEFRWQRDERGFNQLPFRIIVPPATGNLYVAGRCASMTHGAQSAARVTGPCFVMGEAAGRRGRDGAVGRGGGRPDRRAGTPAPPRRPGRVPGPHSTGAGAMRHGEARSKTPGPETSGPKTPGSKTLRSNFTPGSTPWAMRRAQWTALGLTEADLEKPKIAIVNSSSQLASCFSHLDQIVGPLKEAITAAGGVAFEVRTAAPSDAITSAGAAGQYILPSRDLIASDIEVAVEGALLDGMVCLASCDKTTPGQLMAAGRLNIPTIVIGCGYQPSGVYRGEAVDFEDIFRFAGHVNAGRMTVDELGEMSRCAVTGPGVCAGMGTANSMHLAAEALGMALPGTTPVLALGPAMWGAVAAAGERIVGLVEEDVRPRVDPHPGRRSPTPSPRSSLSAGRSTASSTCRRSPSRPGRTSTSTGCSRRSRRRCRC